MRKPHAYFCISNELFFGLLGLPEDAEVVAVEQSVEERLRGEFRVYVRHEGVLMPVPAGARIPQVCPDIDAEGVRLAPKFLKWDEVKWTR